MWGHHLIVNARGCTPSTIRSKSIIQQFSKVLVREIDMVPYGNPKVVMFGTGNKKGYTLVQLIETSNITAHFVEETDDMYLDVFSCKIFDPRKVNFIIDYYFRPDGIDSKLIDRDAAFVMQ